MTRRPETQFRPEVQLPPRASAAQSVPCPFTTGCTGRTDYLTHEILGTVERCRRCGKRQRVTGRAPASEPAVRPRQGVTPTASPTREKPGPKPKPRPTCAASGCTAPAAPKWKTCSRACRRRYLSELMTAQCAAAREAGQPRRVKGAAVNVRAQQLELGGAA